MDTTTYHNKESDEGRALPASSRTTVARLPDRGRYERDAIVAVLDEAWVCHLGITTADGPVVIPTTYARIGDHLVIHGSPASRLLRSTARGIPLCLTVTLVDGLVLARSTFHHSVNYRSVVVMGTATQITDPDEKAAALAAFVEHVVPGRTRDAREATTREVKGTTVLRLPLAEASLKVRTGPPIDDTEDLDLPVWAGVVPLAIVAGPLEPDAQLAATVPVPSYLAPPPGPV